MSLLGSTVQLLPSLPKGAVSTAIQLDQAGNIYVAGYSTPTSLHESPDAFVAKLSPDGSKLIYFTSLAGTEQDAATGLAVGSDGSVYITGNTQSGDFPVTAGALQMSNPMPGQLQGFLVKVDPSGAIVYGTYITSLFITQMTGIALGSGGEVFLTGIGRQADAPFGHASPGFILKLDASLSRVTMTIYGTGGGLVQVDSEGNIYVAGSAQPDLVTTGATQSVILPAFPAGAFQPTHDATTCITFGSGPGGIGASFFCRYQYVAKLNSAGTVLWATYVTGTYGAIVRGMAVDSSGNVIVGGTTNSDDYPVTAGTFQTAYTAATPPLPTVPGDTYKEPPLTMGYITKVNSTGTELVWSTYFGGSSADRITGLAVAPDGDIIVSGRARSSDLPGLQGTPDGCRPSAVQELGFVARIAEDGATAGPTQLVAGAADCTYLNCDAASDYTDYIASWPVAVSGTGMAVTGGTGGTVAMVDFLSSSRVACVGDPADNVQVRTVAPGQLISLFGADLAPALPFIPASGVSTSTNDFGVFFNGIAAPILYSSAQQINVQVPFELAGQTSAQMQVNNNRIPLHLSETHTLAVADRQPAIFLSLAALSSEIPGYTRCGKTVAIGPAALAVNADGTLNDCTNPAAGGSTITLFVNGLGQVTPALTTGTIAPSQPLSIAAGVEIFDPTLSPVDTMTTTLPGALEGVSRVQFQVPAAPASNAAYPVTPRVLSVNVRERLALIWVRAE
ncbi:MAG: SBBP repeat-containing protein [Bryobacteraceae bacterium]